VKGFVGTQAAKHLSMGKNGMISITGMSPAAFAKLGDGAGIVTNLIRSTDRTAGIMLTPTVKDSDGRVIDGAAYTIPQSGGTLSQINPARLPSMDGGVVQTMDTAIAHDLGGHGLQDMWGINYLTHGFNDAYGRITTPGVNFNEPFAMWFENQYRATQGLEIRKYYVSENDYRAP
jgi:hypothetical protein